MYFSVSRHKRERKPLSAWFLTADWPLWQRKLQLKIWHLGKAGVKCAALFQHTPTEGERLQRCGGGGRHWVRRTDCKLNDALLSYSIRAQPSAPQHNPKQWNSEKAIIYYSYFLFTFWFLLLLPAYFPWLLMAHSRSSLMQYDWNSQRLWRLLYYFSYNERTDPVKEAQSLMFLLSW